MVGPSNTKKIKTRRRKWETREKGRKKIIIGRIGGKNEKEEEGKVGKG
jgi:hypothetical protein